MRTSNKYHKFIGYGYKRTGVGTFEDVPVVVKFNYYNEETRKSLANLFKGFQFQAETVYIITEAETGLKTNDKIVIDGNDNLIVNIQSKELHKLGGQRFSTRRKVTIMELS